MNARKFAGAVALVGSLCMVGPLSANAFTLNFSGSVSSAGLNDPWGLIGQTFSGSLVLKDSAVDSNASSALGDYSASVESLLITFSGGSTMGATGGNMGVEDDYYSVINNNYLDAGLSQR